MCSLGFMGGSGQNPAVLLLCGRRLSVSGCCWHAAPPVCLHLGVWEEAGPVAGCPSSKTLLSSLGGVLFWSTVKSWGNPGFSLTLRVRGDCSCRWLFCTTLWWAWTAPSRGWDLALSHQPVSTITLKMFYHRIGAAEMASPLAC